MAKAKKKAAAKSEPLKLDMSFEEAIRRTIQTKLPKKNMSDTYTKEESEMLMKYFSPLLIGKIIETSTRAIIRRIVVSPAGPGKFKVRAEADMQPFNLSSDISKVAQLHELPEPAKVLQAGQDQR